jgi:hypothetical protein
VNGARLTEGGTTDAVEDFGLACLAVSTTLLSNVVLSSVASAGSPLTQGYSCDNGITATYSITGNAKILATGKISLSGVTFTTTNPLGQTLKLSLLVNRVSDPGAQAPYVKNSAAVATSPAGWIAGHAVKTRNNPFPGLFEVHQRVISTLSGGTLTSAAFGAKYKDANPGSGDVVNFQPGEITYDEMSPNFAGVTCTPIGPIGTIASVTE